jgi:hypothetical protein
VLGFIGCEADVIGLQSNMTTNPVDLI